jgi:hypothetical protein
LCDVLYRNAGIPNESLYQRVESYGGSTRINDAYDSVVFEHVAILREDESAEGVVNEDDGLILRRLVYLLVHQLCHSCKIRRHLHQLLTADTFAEAWRPEMQSLARQLQEGEFIFEGRNAVDADIQEILFFKAFPLALLGRRAEGVQIDL